MISFNDIQEARQRVAGYVTRTPLEHSTTLSDHLGTNVYVKLELFQKTGSFKPRGAFNQILQLSQAQRERGVVGVSGGNFAQGLAYAGRVLGSPTVICMPEYTPKNYLDATREYGAEVALAPTFPKIIALAETYQEKGMTFLHPWDSPNQIAGNGTLSMEILEDLPQATDVFISIGGGGLIAGNIVALKALKPEVRIWGVETQGAETMGAALKAGEVVQYRPISLARTIGATYVAEDALTLCQEHLAGYIAVSDREAFDAELYLLERLKVITELAASCTLAAAERVRENFSRTDHVVLVLCGGNTSLDNLMEYHEKLL